MVYAVLVSLKICLVHIFFISIQDFYRKVLVEQMLHGSHILYGMVSQEDFKRDREIIEDILYLLMFLELVERDADDLMVRISFFGDIDGKIIGRSSVHEDMFFVTDYREYAWDGNASQQDGDQISGIKEDEFPGIDVGGSDRGLYREIGYLLGKILGEFLLEIIELQQALLGEDIEGRESERMVGDISIVDLLSGISCGPVASYDRSCADAVDRGDLVFVAQFFQSFQNP